MTEPANQHNTNGEKLETSYEFRAAYREFLQAYDECILADKQEDAYISLVRSGVCLERSQDWRALSALWEMMGNRLGEAAYPGSRFPSPNEPGQSGMFHIMSWTRWSDPEKGYYEPEDVYSKRKHQQFWAYLWAAEALQVERHHRKAAENFRKAAASVLHSQFGDRLKKTAEGYWTEERILAKSGMKFKLAADCFFKAARNDVMAYGELKAPYSYTDIKWTALDKVCTTGLGPDRRDDLDRLHECWAHYRSIREPIGDSENAADAVDEELRQLTEIQHRLRNAGNEKENRGVFARRRRLEISIARGLHKIRLSLTFFFLDSSLLTRIAANSVLVALLTCLIIPFVYYRYHLLVVEDSATRASFLECILHSLASTVSTSIEQIRPTYPAGQFLTVIQSFLLFFFLAYIVFVWTKKPED